MGVNTSLIFLLSRKRLSLVSVKNSLKKTSGPKVSSCINSAFPFISTPPLVLNQHNQKDTHNFLKYGSNPFPQSQLYPDSGSSLTGNK